MDVVILILAIACPVAAGVFAFRLVKEIMANSPGTEEMQKISHAVRVGAMAFLRTEYSVLCIFAFVVFLVLGIFIDWPTAICYAFGALASGTAGYFGMWTATNSAGRTAEAAKGGLGKALRVAFSSGAVMGLAVVGLGLLGVTVFYIIFGRFQGLGVEPIFGFSFGASSIALFARVGGGIFTKAADVGADLVGKVEAGIPEDDPRNPAVIADNVGDNVGDVAIIATMALAAGMAGFGMGVLLPLAVAAFGIIGSIVGTFFVKTEDETKLHSALFRGMIVAGVVMLALLVLFMLPLDLDFSVGGKDFTKWGSLLAIAVGLATGSLIGLVTEYYTSEGRKPAREIAPGPRRTSSTASRSACSAPRVP